jgi:hypothetical protein
MLNPESVMLNLFQHLFGAGLFQHPVKSRSCDPKIVDPELDSGHGSGWQKVTFSEIEVLS